MQLGRTQKMEKKRYHTIHICTFMFRSSFSNVDNISILQRFINDDKDYLGRMSNGIHLKTYIILRGDRGGTDPPLETGVGVWSPPWQKKIVPPLRVKKD